LKIASSPIKEKSKERKNAMDVARSFVEDCPNKLTPKDKKKARKEKRQALTSIKTWDDSLSYLKISILGCE
jgi:hypothetical protein